MKKNKKMIISIIFVLIFTLTIFSGCVNMKTFPIMTLIPVVNGDYQYILLIAEVGVPFCKVKDCMFVYDNKSHENWSDYKFRKESSLYYYRFHESIPFFEVLPHVTYYVRAVAYCYDFKKPFENYTDGYYQGAEKTFIRSW